MSASRQERRRLGRCLKALGKAPLDANEISAFKEGLSATSEDVKLAAGRCAACPSTSGERKSCHVCGFVRYCNRECQTSGWSSHKLVCRVLAADREIANKLLPSSSLLPLDTIWELLRSGSHVEAFEATAHLSIWGDRCGLQIEPASCDLELIGALRAELAAADGIALLVSGLAAGGLRAMVAAEALERLVAGHPETGAAIIAAGALPPIIYALALPSKHADLGDLWSLCAAANCVAALIESLTWFSGPAEAITGTAGAIPALILHLNFVLGDAFPPPHWPARCRDPSHFRCQAIRAISAFFACADKAGSEDGVSNARAFIADGAAHLIVNALGSLSPNIPGCLALLLRHSDDVVLARQLGSDLSKIADIIRGGRDTAEGEHGAFLLNQILRLAPEFRAAAEETGALAAAAAHRARRAATRA